MGMWHKLVHNNQKEYTNLQGIVQEGPQRLYEQVLPHMKEHHQFDQSNDLELIHSNRHRCTVLHTPTNRDRLSIGGEVAGIGIPC
jgi:hypothetical protein